jgi:hypothetical protein
MARMSYFVIELVKLSERRQKPVVDVHVFVAIHIVQVFRIGNVFLYALHSGQKNTDRRGFYGFWTFDHLQGLPFSVGFVVMWWIASTKIHNRDLSVFAISILISLILSSPLQASNNLLEEPFFLVHVAVVKQTRHRASHDIKIGLFGSYRKLQLSLVGNVSLFVNHYHDHDRLFVAVQIPRACKTSWNWVQRTVVRFGQLKDVVYKIPEIFGQVETVQLPWPRFCWASSISELPFSQITSSEIDKFFFK